MRLNANWRIADQKPCATGNSSGWQAPKLCKFIVQNAQD
jgi:hypothetical protein